jgi:hemoglobin-like flavoprotein
MEWVISLVEGSDIEEVTDDMLEKMIIKEEKLSVLFYEENEEMSNQVVTVLETIDDDLDEMDVLLVKVNEASVASDFGIDDRPCLVVFEQGIPNVFEGDLTNVDQVLEWIIGEISGDHTVEVVTDAMLDRMVDQYPHVAVFFYDKDGHQPSLRALEALETIDDDVQKHSEIKLVKIDDPEEALEYGLTNLPALVFFEHKLPNIFEGHIEDSDEVLEWITSLAMEDNIELVTGHMMEKLLEDHSNLAVFLHDRLIINN